MRQPHTQFYAAYIIQWRNLTELSEIITRLRVIKQDGQRYQSVSLELLFQLIGH